MRSQGPFTGWNSLKWFLSLVILVGIATACEDSITGPDEPESQILAAPHIGIARGPGSLTVMTWNVYVGADVDKVLAAETPDQIPVLVAEAFQMLLATNFPERAEAFVDQIERARPHLIGLQEISLIRTQSPGDAIFGGSTPAEDVAFDFLEILMNALQARGLDYTVAGIVQNADVEVPMIVDPATWSFDDVRLTDFDVVLARGDVDISRVTEANYAAKLPVPGFGIEIPRGYVAVDARVGRKTYRFVSTHLEPAPIPEILPVQLGQAQELAATLEKETLPVILVGDFNSPAPDGDTYQFLLSQGYVDVWTRNRARREGEGLTNAHPLNLRSDDIQLSQRIDFIFARNAVGRRKKDVIGPVFARVVGDEFADRTISGMWPSDHAGVVASLRIPPLGRFARR